MPFTLLYGLFALVVLALLAVIVYRFRGVWAALFAFLLGAVVLFLVLNGLIAVLTRNM